MQRGLGLFVGVGQEGLPDRTRVDRNPGVFFPDFWAAGVTGSVAREVRDGAHAGGTCTLGEGAGAHTGTGGGSRISLGRGGVPTL